VRLFKKNKMFLKRSARYPASPRKYVTILNIINVRIRKCINCYCKGIVCTETYGRYKFFVSVTISEYHEFLIYTRLRYCKRPISPIVYRRRDLYIYIYILIKTV